MVNPSSSGRGEDSGLFVWGLLPRMVVNEPDGEISLSVPATACFHCNYALATLFAARCALAKTKVRESELDTDSEPACEASSKSKSPSVLELELGFEPVMVNLHHRIAPPPRRATVAAACVVLC